MKENRRKVVEIAVDLELPLGLPSPEEALKTMSSAIHALSAPRLTSVEIKRLRHVGQVLRAYERMIAEIVRCKRLELELLERAVKHELLARRVQAEGRRVVRLWPKLKKEVAARRHIEARPTGR